MHVGKSCGDNELQFFDLIACLFQFFYDVFYLVVNVLNGTKCNCNILILMYGFCFLSIISENRHTFRIFKIFSRVP